MQTICKRIKALRIESGLSQYQLADKVPKLNQSQLSKIENRKRKVSVDELVSISIALETSVNDIIGKDES